MKPFIWDNHQCMPLRPDDVSFLPQLRSIKNGGIDIVSLNIGFDSLPWHTCIQMLATFRRWLKQHQDEYYLVESVEDIETGLETEKLGVTFDIEGGGAINNHLPMIQLYYDLGVRWMLFAYNTANSLGGGCREIGSGLTSFGAQVLEEMERVGMVVCCSHINQKTAMDIIHAASNPVIFSHSNPCALKNHYRNISDEVIIACAGIGGVIGITGVGALLEDSKNIVDSYIGAIDYTVQLVGPEHVGLGTDYAYDKEELFAYVSKHASVYGSEDIENVLTLLEPRQLSQVAEGLLQRNYLENDVRAILGGNFLRIAKSVWR